MKKFIMFAILFGAAGSAFALTDVEFDIRNNFATQISYICHQGLALPPFSDNPYGDNVACNDQANAIQQAYQAVEKGASNDLGAYRQMHNVLVTLGGSFDKQGWANNFKQFVWNNFQIKI